eukprot:686804-Amorphochlora_amoeboformis.AAC.1
MGVYVNSVIQQAWLSYALPMRSNMKDGKCSSASSALERLQWVATFNTESQFDPVAFQDGVPSQHLKQFAKRALQSAQ